MCFYNFSKLSKEYVLKKLNWANIFNGPGNWSKRSINTVLSQG